MSPRRVVPLALLCVALLATAAAPAAAPLAHREVLPNGIVLLVSERPAVPIVVVRVFTRGGAVLDPSGREGLANLTGSLLTRGTARRTGPELDAAIEFVGGGLDAGAGRDGMTASLVVLKKDLGLGLDLLGEVVLAPTFPEAELTRKVAEIQAAIKRSEESPDTVASRALARLVYPGHPYGTPLEGTSESVARLTRDDVVRFHREWMRPDTAIVAVVGAITVADARREILARFGGWAKPATPPPSIPMAAAGPAPREERIERDFTQATILLGRQSIRQVDPDYFPLAVANYIVGGGSTGRLYTRVREEGGFAYSVGSYVSPGKYGSSAVVSSQTRTAEAKRVIDLIREELARLGREPVSDRELDLAKSYLIGSFPLRLDTSRKVADFIVAVEEQGLGLDYADRYIERIRQVTAADVQRVAAKYLRPDTFNLVIVGGSR
ncbi:MAG: insulinase family protein [Candidatus Rokubacteria bacterium]|nr:insulinase family protein [Candidatus Rokubacteria bacterium]